MLKGMSILPGLKVRAKGMFKDAIKDKGMINVFNLKKSPIH